MDINFAASPSDRVKINKVTDRACAVAKLDKVRLGKTDTRMDLTATHLNGNPLDLDRMLATDDFNLMHDVYGIARHLDRETGKLTGHFSPRCSLREKAEAA